MTIPSIATFDHGTPRAGIFGFNPPGDPIVAIWKFWVGISDPKNNKCIFWEGRTYWMGIPIISKATLAPEI